MLKAVINAYIGLMFRVGAPLEQFHIIWEWSDGQPVIMQRCIWETEWAIDYLLEH